MYEVTSISLVQGYGAEDEYFYLVQTSYGLHFALSRRTCRVLLVSPCCNAIIKLAITAKDLLSPETWSVTASGVCDECKAAVPYLPIDPTGSHRKPMEQVATEALIDPYSSVMVNDSLQMLVEELMDLPNSPDEYDRSRETQTPEAIQAQLDPFQGWRFYEPVTGQ